MTEEEIMKDPYGWDTDSDPEDDPGLVKLISRVAKTEVDPASLPLPDFKRLCRRLHNHKYPVKYAMLGTKRLKRTEYHKSAEGRLSYCPEELELAKARVDPVKTQYAVAAWEVMNPRYRPSSPRFDFHEKTGVEEEKEVNDEDNDMLLCVTGDCHSFAKYTTREDVGEMLTLVRPCMGDFDLQVAVACPGCPFSSCISRRKYGPRHVDHAARRLVGLPAYSILEDSIGFGVFSNVNGYGRWVRGACTAPEVLDHLATGVDGPNICIYPCYGNPDSPPVPTQELDAAAQALVAVLTKYGNLQEAIAPGCTAPIARVLAVYMPDGNDRNVEVVTTTGIHVGVYFATS
jgi:hypothetical protein